MLNGKKLDVYYKSCFYLQVDFKHSFENSYPAGTFLFKAKNTNTRTSCEICSELTIKTPERRLCQYFFFNKVVALRACLRDYHNLIANNRTRTFFKCLTWYEIVHGTAKYMYDVFVSNGNSFYQYCALYKNCPNTEFFLVRIFLYSVRIQENTNQKKLRIWTLFTQCVRIRVKAPSVEVIL